MSTAPSAQAAGSPFQRLSQILGMIKFSHTLFALPFAVMGALLASVRGGQWTFRPLDWLGILLCMVSARSAAMAFNRLVDREIDARNPRTAGRHLPAGILTPRQVARFVIGSSLLFIASTALFLPRNPLPIVLSVPVLAWLLGYSFAKRYTSLVHFWLGASLAFAPVAAWIAIRGGVAWTPVFLGLAVFTWVAGFDIIYACQDESFDRATGLHSIPARLGARRALWLAAACHGLTLVFLAAVGWSYPLGRTYQAGVGLAAVLLLVEHLLVRPERLQRVNISFFYVNIVLSLGMLVVTALDVWL